MSDTQRDAERDARDRALYVFDADGRWVGRREVDVLRRETD